MKKHCRTVRELLDKKNFQIDILPSWASKHLQSCEACHDFAAHYPALTAALREELTKSIAPLPAPDFSFLKNLASGRKERSTLEKNLSRQLLPWAAALMVLAFNFLFNDTGIFFKAPHPLLTEDSRLFINKLYASPLLAQPASSVLLPEAEATDAAAAPDAEAILPAEWFQVTALETGLSFSSELDSLLSSTSLSGSM